MNTSRQSEDLPQSELPAGEEREVRRLDRVAIDGAPIAYVLVLAAVVAALAFIPIPISVVIGSGKNFPMSQSIYPLVGWLLGPVAGAVADGIGALVGVIVAPHTTTSAPATVLGAVLGGFAAGAMTVKERRAWWWAPLAGVFVIFYGLYAGRAVFINGAAARDVLLGSFINWSALLLFVLPTRVWFARLLAERDLKRIGIGLFGGTWIVAGLSHLATGTIVYAILNWASEYWLVFAPVAPLEHLVRCLVGAIIGTGAIAGLRATGLIKPTYAAY
ncbi:MAG TPA: hypothetical protein PKH77_17235 [Anaerolineae bacterium]|nr:hypothetical protein [Anaerolineae bacterium]